MHDVDRIYPYTQRRNYHHRARLTHALQHLGIVDHTFPTDFFRRHWRDQQRYLEQVLHLNFCSRCKLPVTILEGALCERCAERNMNSWASSRALRETQINRSLSDKEVVPEDIRDRFKEHELERVAKSYGAPLEEIRDLLTPTKDITTVADILNTARGRK